MHGTCEQIDENRKQKHAQQVDKDGMKRECEERVARERCVDGKGERGERGVGCVSVTCQVLVTPASENARAPV